MRISSLLLIVALVLSLSSCTKHGIDSENNGIDKAKKALHEKGFDVTSLVEQGEYYLVEGDILINKRDLYKVGAPLTLNRAVQKRNDQASTTDPLVSISTINIYIDPAVSSDWVTAVTNSASLWNSIPNFGIYFDIISNPGIAHITVSNGTIAGTDIAAGAFSSGGAPGSSIIIDPAKSTNDAGHRQLIMTHEIGHTIGIRHTDYNSEGGSLNHIPGTYPSNGTWPNPDPASIFNRMSSQINLNGRSFTRHDVIAIRYMYPSDNTQVPLYRYNNGGKHLYNTNWADLGTGNYGWGYEWAEGYIFNISAPNRLSVYRYRNNSSNTYFMTTNWGELGNGKYGYQYEGIIGYAYSGSTYYDGLIPLYQFFKSTVGHLYTTDYGEGTSNGFTYEKVAFYVVEFE